MTEFLCFGHRGACGYEPENTLRSVRAALRLGVPWIEIDVYAIENELLVFHDDRLERVSNGSGLIWQRSLSYLRGLDVGKGEQIPTLREVFDSVNRAAGINVELKGKGTAERVIPLINEYISRHKWDRDQFLVSSFNHPELAIARSLDESVRRGALTCSIPMSLAQFGSDLGAYSVNMAAEFIDEPFIADAHRRGMKVFVYTVNHVDDALRFRSMGCDGVFSDFPDKIMAAVQNA